MKFLAPAGQLIQTVMYNTLYILSPMDCSCRKGVIKWFFFKFRGWQGIQKDILWTYPTFFLPDSMYSEPAKLLLKYNAAHLRLCRNQTKRKKKHCHFATELLIMYSSWLHVLQAYLGSINSSGGHQIDFAAQD